MHWVLKRIDFDKHISVLLTSLLLFSSICLTSSKEIIIFVCIVLVSIEYFIFMLLARKKVLINSYDIWLVLVFLLLVVNSTISPYKGGFSLKYFMLICTSIICCCFFIKDNRVQLNMFVGEVVTVTSIVSILYIAINELPTFIHNYSEISSGYIRYRIGTISGINATAIASFLGILNIITFYFVFIEKKYNMKYIYALQIVMTVLSGSKKGLIMVLIPVILFSLKVGLKSIRNVIVIAVVLSLVGIAIFRNPLLYNVMGYRILDALNELGIAQNIILPESALIDESTKKRVEMIETAWKMFSQKPILGWGWNAFAALAGYGYYCHNNYLEIMVSMGIIGFIIYYVMPLSLLVGNIKQINKSKRFLCISLILSVFFLDFTTITVYDQVIVYFIYAFLFLSEGFK